MTISKWKVGGLGLVALGAVGFAVRTFWVADEANGALAEVRRRSEELHARIATLEKRRATEAGRAEAVERDNAELASAMQRTQAAVANSDTGSVSREAFADRVKRAMALVRSGASDEAVRELLSCYRMAIAKPGLLAFGQISYFVGALATLSESHPEVRAELRERFEQGKRRVLGSDDDTEPVGEMGMIARAFKDDQMMVAVWDAIPASDSRRQLVASYAVAGLIAKRCYADALSATSYGAISARFESNSSRSAASGASDAGVNSLIKTTAANIELLAGAGDLVHARELAVRLLAVDGSEATRALVQQHLERAGQAGLLQGAGK